MPLRMFMPSEDKPKGPRKDAVACGLPLNMMGYGLTSHWKKNTLSRENGLTSSRLREDFKIKSRVTSVC
jgi:hypothetical protein